MELSPTLTRAPTLIRAMNTYSSTPRSIYFFHNPAKNKIIYFTTMWFPFEHLEKYGRATLYGSPGTYIVKQTNLLFIDNISFDQAASIAAYLDTTNQHKHPISTFNLDDHPELLI